MNLTELNGHGQPIFQSVKGISDKEIAEAVEAAKQEAKEQTKYHMFDLLREHWDNRPTPLVLEEVELVEDDEKEIDKQEDTRDDMKSELLLEATSVQESANVKSGISDLYNAGRSTNEENETLISLHQSVLRKVPSKTIPLYDEETCSNHKYCPFVNVQKDRRDLFISKTTLVWSLQKSERVSSDCHFRVRAKQPYANDGIRFVSQILLMNSMCIKFNTHIISITSDKIVIQCIVIHWCQYLMKNTPNHAFFT